MTLLLRICQAIDQRGLIRRGDRGGVAFSGGADSLCLLHLLARLRDERALQIEAIHVDHGLRPGSADEARAARELGLSLGVEVSVLQAGLDPLPAGNLQDSARRRRLALLEEQVAARGLDWIALAHTASDQAETVLMRAVRGAGVRGLAGMDWRRGPLIRPLLGISRREVEAYLARHGLRPVVDPSNATDRYLRNRLRHHVLPLLARENPRVEEALCRLADNCREEDEALEAQVAGLVRAVGAEAGVRALRELPAGLQARVIRTAHQQAVGAASPRLERRHVEAVLELLSHARGSQSVDLPGARLERRYDRLIWVVRAPPEVRTGPFTPVQLEGPGRVQLSDGRTVVVSTRTAGGEGRALVLERIGFPLTLRPPRAGDRFRVGARARRRVFRVLMDAKISRSERGSVPLVIWREEVVQIVGLRVAHGWMASGAGIEILVTGGTGAEEVK